VVKINNLLGDIKRGKQAGSAYQLRYGQQIRRTISPKRHIVSKAQTSRRNLFKEALAWRGALTLSERQFLEGYAIAHRVIDDYGIPLPWSKFALKVYLEVPRVELQP